MLGRCYLWISLASVVAAGCRLSGEGPQFDTHQVARFEQGDTAYVVYHIPRDLDEAELTNLARELHKNDDPAWLIFVNAHQSRFQCVHPSFQIGNRWNAADSRHVVATLRRLRNGRWVLCRGTGDYELAEF